MPKGMVITVGVGRGIEHAIVLSIKNANPDFVVFLVTPQSKGTLERIEQMARELNFQLPPYEPVEIANEDDAQEAYKAAVRAIRKLGEKGIAPANITIDYTTGSKPMSAGALYAAITENCADVIYVTGQRDENGRVISGTERFLFLTPNELLARRYLAEAVRLFNAWQFSAAKQLLDEFLRPFPTAKVEQLFPQLEGLRRMCDAYQAWDAFDHIKAKEAFDNVDKTVMQEWSAKDQIAKNKGWVNRLAQNLQSQDLNKQLCEELLVDLWANALRRLKEERFVDAVARLYRLAELIAQYRLWHNYRIDTSDVDMSKVPEGMKEKLERYRNEKGKVQIPLKASYELLAALGDEIGKAWDKPKLKDAISARNRSIAAHGLEPVSRTVAENLKGEVEPLLREVVPNLDRLVSDAEFPSLQP
ncbi:MAG: TIGR02710 family CRISPR-associated CARF protein [Armatimonadota bacterium]